LRSSLFFLTAYQPGIGLSGDGVLWLEERNTFVASMRLRWSLKIYSNFISSPTHDRSRFPMLAPLVDRIL